MAHAYNPSHLERWGQEDPGSMPSQANSLQDPISKIKQIQMNQRCGSSSRMPALQVWSPEFKPQFHQKNKYNAFFTLSCGFFFLSLCIF
jgi:hypothetical protein